MRLRASVAIAGVLVTHALPASAQQPLPLDTLRVTVGSRLDPRVPGATRAVEVIPASEIRRLPAATLADVLAWALGADVQARSPAQADVGLRGSSSEQVLVLVDGVRATDPQTGHFALDQAVPLDEVERIEVLRGAASAQYGADALGGVINIVTRAGSALPGADAALPGPAVSARLAGGSFGTGALALRAGGGTGDVRADAAGEVARSDGWRPGTDSRTGSARAGFAARLGGRTLRGAAAYAARDFGARAFYTDPAAPFDEYEKTRTATLELGLDAPPAAALVVEPRVSIRRHDDDFVLRRLDPAFYRNVHRSWQIGGELVARGRAFGHSDSSDGRVRLAAGTEAYRDLLRSTSLGDRDESRAAAFGEVSAGSAGRAVVTAGVREDWHSRYGAFAAPSLAAAIWARPVLRLRAAAGRAFRAPTWTDRYYRDPANIGDPDLRPERAWEGEVGADLLAAGGARLSVTGFTRRTSDLIDWVRPAGAPPATTPWQAQNVGTATFRGAELEGSALDPLGSRWLLRATALGFSAAAATAASKYALRPLTRTASLSVDRVVARRVALGGRAAYARHAGETGYWLLDARVSVESGAAQLYLDGRNLGNARYRDVSRMEAPGREWDVGLRWR